MNQLARQTAWPPRISRRRLVVSLLVFLLVFFGILHGTSTWRVLTTRLAYAFHPGWGDQPSVVDCARVSRWKSLEESDFDRTHVGWFESTGRRCFIHDWRTGSIQFWTIEGLVDLSQIKEGVGPATEEPWAWQTPEAAAALDAPWVLEGSTFRKWWDELPKTGKIEL